MDSKPNVLVIVGPTASGKTSLSIKLAKLFDGEVVSADSRQVYRGLDLGSGKVTKEEMGGVPHHLLDVTEPTTVYTASDFARDGVTAIDNIVNRSHLPIIAGGTFFYVDTLLGATSIPSVPPNAALRQELSNLPLESLLTRLTVLDPNRAANIDFDNPRRLIRAIEIATALGHVPAVTTIPRYRTLTLGIAIDTETLHHNIHTRLIERLDTGMIAEVEGLLSAGVTHERLEDLGLEYRYISRYLCGALSYDTMVVELETKIRQFAKRQMTWLKRNKDIIWVNPHNISDISRIVEDFLDPKSSR